MASPDDGDAELRIDNWLWFARFYKSRGLATQAVKGGAVHVNGARVRSSRRLRVNDTLQMTHPGGRFVITVLDIPSRRGPATEASACYRIEEHVRPEVRRKKASAGISTRPDKKGRRQLRKLKGR